MGVGPVGRAGIPKFLAYLNYARQMIIFFVRKRESLFFKGF